MGLTVDLNIDDPDGVYERLVAMHRGLTDQESMRLNARLILLLINVIGDRDLIFEAIAMASQILRESEAAV